MGSANVTSVLRDPQTNHNLPTGDHLHAVHHRRDPRQRSHPVGRAGQGINADGQERLHRDLGHLGPLLVPLHHAVDIVGGDPLFVRLFDESVVLTD